jgi:hypothetical protein
MENRDLKEAASAACRALRSSNDLMEAEVREALDRGDYLVTFADDLWGYTSCDHYDGFGVCVQEHLIW